MGSTSVYPDISFSEMDRPDGIIPVPEGVDLDDPAYAYSYAAVQLRRQRREAAEAARREALGPDSRRHEDFGRLWAQNVAPR